MKKIFAIMMTICLLVAAVCITVFAADAPASDVVLRISALKKDGTTVVLNDYTVFEEGWNAAMALADNSKEMKKNDYDRIVVDFYADWNANEDGEFTKDGGDGFKWGTIYFQDDVRMTLNLNGHTINRGLKDWEYINNWRYNGEVMYIDEDADVIINDGTITGGFSCNGAGGIHIHDADVTLNNVNIVGNSVEDDKGAGIALYDDAVLTMNGGCISNNRFYHTDTIFEYTEGALYVDDSVAVLNNVVISGNDHAGKSGTSALVGVAVSLEGDAEVTLNNCLVENNGIKENTDATSIFYADDDDCVLTLNNTDIKNNGIRTYSYYELGSSAIFMSRAKLTINGGKIEGNHTRSIFSVMPDGSSATKVEGTAIINNDSRIIGYDFNCDPVKYTFTNCTFNNNRDPESKYAFHNENHSAVGIIGNILFVDCDLGDSTFSTKQGFSFSDSSKMAAGSIFGEGSLIMGISLLALAASIASVGVCISLHKKNVVPATANKAQETEGKDEK